MLCFDARVRVRVIHCSLPLSPFLSRGSCARGAQISGVVWMFSYPLRTALAVGLSMAQIGEFAFVLLSVASHQGLLAYQVYMLLMGAPRPARPPLGPLQSRPLLACKLFSV